MRYINSFKNSLGNKLFLVFISIGLLPFLTLLAYTLLLSQNKIVNKVVAEQLDKADVVVKLINNQVNSLEKEVQFLAGLDLMDDLLVDDIDKRISRLLSHKAKDLNLNLDFFVLNNDSIIVASSNKEYISQKYFYSDPNKKNSISGENLYFSSPIQASFDKAKNIGSLVLRYNIDNLDIYMTFNNHIHSYIFDPLNKKSNTIPFKPDPDAKVNYIIDDEHLTVYKRLPVKLNNSYIVYAVDKDIALEFLYDYISFMLIMALLIFILIIYISIKYSRTIVKPIEKLTQVTDNITKTQNYSAHLEVDSHDEIATLTHSFNDMLKTTTDALSKLENENQLRLQRFTQLINVFNTIIQTKSEDECIDISMQEIKKITQNENLHFLKVKNKDEDKTYKDIYVSEFEKNEKIYFGSIELDSRILDDENEQNFYNAIVSMVSLQLDRIRLIDNTMSVSKAKSAFISNMSHELRTPLNAIIGSTQYLAVYEDLSDEQIDTVANIESSAGYLLNMINDILDIAKIESGKMEAKLEDVNIKELVQTTVEMLSPLAYDKDLNFHFQHTDFKELYYQSDAKIFRQILINLISNAIKFTDTGSISVILDEDDTNILIYVKDTGVGIDKKDLELLFEDFTQLQNIMHKKHKGTGLGLSLSKKMAQILGGSVSLESQGVNCGTTAIFYLPKSTDILNP